MIIFCTKTHIQFQAHEIITQPVIAKFVFFLIQCLRCLIFYKKVRLCLSWASRQGGGGGGVSVLRGSWQPWQQFPSPWPTPCPLAGSHP